MVYLCVMYRAHAVPIGNHTTVNNVEAILSRFPLLKQFYTDKVQVGFHMSCVLCWFQPSVMQKI